MYIEEKILENKENYFKNYLNLLSTLFCFILYLDSGTNITVGLIPLIFLIFSFLFTKIDLIFSVKSNTVGLIIE